MLPPPRGIGADVVHLFEALSLFREPIAGLEPQLAHVEGALEEIAVDPLGSLSEERVALLASEAHAARTRIREAAYQQLHRDPYRAEMAAGILARVPAELDALNQQVVVTACTHLGFTIEGPARGGSSRLSSATRRSLTACREFPPARATLARSIARKRSKMKRWTSSRPAIRLSKASSRISTRAAWAASRESRSRSAARKEKVSSPSTKTAPRSKCLRSIPRASRGPNGRRRSGRARSGRAA